MAPKILAHNREHLMSKLLLCCILLGSVLFLSCIPDVPEECEDFLALPVARQVEVFRTFPVEKQLHVYTCDYRYSHPSNASLATALAERGENIVPILIDRLRQEDDERNLEPIIHILELMYKRGYLRDREDVVNFIRNAVSNMKRPAVKEVNQEMLRSIERQISTP